MSKSSRVAWVLIAESAACLAGCNDSESDIARACGGSRPRIEACERGLCWASCIDEGSGGQPVLGCHEETGRCLLFADGCVAAEYRASPCPTEDLCCESIDGRPWSFTDAWQERPHDERPVDGTDRDHGVALGAPEGTEVDAEAVQRVLEAHGLHLASR